MPVNNLFFFFSWFCHCFLKFQDLKYLIEVTGVRFNFHPVPVPLFSDGDKIISSPKYSMVISAWVFLYFDCSVVINIPFIADYIEMQSYKSETILLSVVWLCHKNICINIVSCLSVIFNMLHKSNNRALRDRWHAPKMSLFH